MFIEWRFSRRYAEGGFVAVAADAIGGRSPGKYHVGSGFEFTLTWREPPVAENESADQL